MGEVSCDVVDDDPPAKFEAIAIVKLLASTLLVIWIRR
jgi:hypothetical protein